MRINNTFISVNLSLARIILNTLQTAILDCATCKKRKKNRSKNLTFTFSDPFKEDFNIMFFS